VEKGSVILVPRGEFHRVFNSSVEKLVFATVFEGSRTSKKYSYNDK
jgi:oxalate decarboxylase/phosphoglucose isomerase-like protein (cupin superfamily)